MISGTGFICYFSLTSEGSLPFSLCNFKWLLINLTHHTQCAGLQLSYPGICLQHTLCRYLHSLSEIPTVEALPGSNHGVNSTWHKRPNMCVSVRKQVWPKMKMRKGAVKDYWVSQTRYFSSEEGVDLLIRGGQEKHQIHFCSFNTASIPLFVLSSGW